MKYVFFSLFLLFFLILEATFIAIPLVMLILILGFVRFQEEWLFLVALVAGVIIDSLLYHTFGLTSLYFVSLLFLIFLYKRRFEIKTMQFVFLATLISSFFYLLLFGSQNILLQTLTSGVLGAVGYAILGVTSDYESRTTFS